MIIFIDYQCEHSKIERCLYYNNMWWDLCLSCGSMWGSIAWEKDGKWDAEYVSNSLKNITQ